MKRLTLILGKAAGGLVTATATPFVHEGPRRAAENCNCKTFCPRRATEGGGELQLQDLLSTEGREGRRRTATARPFVHEGPRRAAENCNCRTFCPRRAAKGGGDLQLQHLLSTKGHEGPRRTATAEGQLQNFNCNTFCLRRAAENCNIFCPRRAAKGHEELQLQKGNCRTSTATLFVCEGRRRTATARPFVHEGPRRATKGHEELQL